MENQDSTALCKVQRFTPNGLDAGEDCLAVEEPLEIRLRDGRGDCRSISVTMRTPGQDRFLALGFLFSEGILQSREVVRDVVFVPTFESTGQGNVLEVSLNAGVVPDWDRLQRHFYTSSSCGVCGKASIEAVTCQLPPTLPSPTLFTVSAEILCTLPELLNNAQTVFGKTGGLHGAGCFSSKGHLQMSFEDVGRHNALDKLLGRLFWEQKIPLRECILLVSGRASFELVQKALMGGFAVMAAIGAPSSLAVELATEHDLTLVGFLTPNRFNIYSGHHRILS